VESKLIFKRQGAANTLKEGDGDACSVVERFLEGGGL
jgi:hypothetical protein